jgi:hypothetical protein
MTDITNNYGSLIEIIRLVNAEQAKVFNGKKKNYADIVKFREVLGSALATQPCSTHDGGYSWLVDTEEDYIHRVGATTPYTVQSMPKRPLRPTEPPISASISAYKRYTIDQHNLKPSPGKTRLTNEQDRDHAPQLLPTAAPQQTNGEHGPSGATPMAPT